MSELPPHTPDRPDDLPLADWQAHVEAAGMLLPLAIRHRVRSAFAHLRKAWRLHGLDNEMSAFRAITAEEEAATALILSLRQQKYPGSGKLNHRNHQHKNSIWLMISIINNLLYETGVKAPSVSISSQGTPRVNLQIDLISFAGHTGKPIWIEVDHPLNFAIQKGNLSDKIVHLFEGELNSLTSKSGDKSIFAHLENHANIRNKILYASDNGIPSVEISEKYILERVSRISVITILTIIILQTPVHQLLVVQCLEAILVALNKIVDVKFEYGNMDISDGRDLIKVERIGSEPGSISLTRAIHAWVSWSMPQPAWRWPTPVVSNLNSLAFDEHDYPGDPSFQAARQTDEPDT